MKITAAVLASIALHALIAWTTPAARHSARTREPSARTISFIGAKPDFSELFDRGALPRPGPKQTHFYPPESRAVVIEPPQISFDLSVEFPAPELGFPDMPGITEGWEEGISLEKELEDYSRESLAPAEDLSGL